jgi:hypothetical protein
MLTIEMTWQEAATASAGLFASAAAAAAAARLLGPPRPRLAAVSAFAREAGILLGLFALWQLSGSFARHSPQGAVQRGEWIWHAERDAGLPSEAAIQHVFLPHPLLVQAINLYYDVLHFPVLIGCLIWLFIWHRNRYGRVRTTLVLFTASALLIQLITVAPPRLLPGDGMTDTALLYGQSVYGPHAVIDPDQLSAMPSVHVGWALLVAVTVVGAARSRWRRLALAYPALTTLVVVVTANHYWLDGIAAAALLGLAFAVQFAGRAVRIALAARLALPGHAADKPVVGGIALYLAGDIRTPFRQRNQAGLDKFPVAEPGQDLLMLPPQAGSQLLVEQSLHRAGLRRILGMLGAGHTEAGDSEVTARYEGVTEPGRDAGRVLIVVYVMQDGEHEEPDRAAEVDEPPDLGILQDLRRPADIRGDHPRRPRVGQQRLAVHQDDRVDIDVDDTCGGVDLLRDLMYVSARGQPGTDVKELGDSGFLSQVADHPPQERAVGRGTEGGVRHYLQGELDHGPVGREIVLPAKESVIDACDIRLRDVEATRNRLPSSHRKAPLRS